MKKLKEVLVSSSFIEKAIILLISTLLAGILIPLVKSYMDNEEYKKRKIFEAKIARTNELIKTQSQFINEFSKLAWEFQLSAITVSYYGSSKDIYKDIYKFEELKRNFEKAKRDYKRNSWRILEKIRGLVGGASWYISKENNKKLSIFIDEWLLIDLDAKLEKKILRRREWSNAKDDEDWDKFHNWLYKQTKVKTEEILSTLAQDFQFQKQLSTEK